MFLACCWFRPTYQQEARWSISWSTCPSTWIDFGRVLAAKLEPSWDQVATKPDPTSNQKNDHFLVGLRNDFGWILAPNLPPKRRNSNWQISTFLALGAILAPRRPQDAPRSPKRRPRQPPRPILEPFWLIFGWFFGCFFGWFGGSINQSISTF